MQALQLLRLFKSSQTHPPSTPCCPTGSYLSSYHFNPHKIPRRLNTSKTEPLRVGHPYTLSCHVADHVEVESCSWQFGSGPQISAPRPGSTGGVQQPREGRISQSSKSCNLTLHSLSLEHMGTWTCRYNTISANAHFYDFVVEHVKSLVQDQSLLEQPVAGGEN